VPLIAVAKFVGCFGIRGELKCRPTPAGELTLVPGSYASRADGAGERIVIEELRRVGGRLVVRLAGVGRIEDAAAFVNREIFLEREAIVLGDGEYLDDDLVGLRLTNHAGDELGTVARIDHYPASECLVLASGGLVPLVKAFVRRIDVAAGTIVVELPEGLLEPG